MLTSQCIVCPRVWFEGVISLTILFAIFVFWVEPQTNYMLPNRLLVRPFQLKLTFNTICGLYLLLLSFDSLLLTISEYISAFYLVFSDYMILSEYTILSTLCDIFQTKSNCCVKLNLKSQEHVLVKFDVILTMWLFTCPGVCVTCAVFSLSLLYLKHAGSFR